MVKDQIVNNPCFEIRLPKKAEKASRKRKVRRRQQRRGGDAGHRSHAAPLSFRKSEGIEAVWIERGEGGERRAASVGFFTHLAVIIVYYIVPCISVGKPQKYRTRYVCKLYIVHDIQHGYNICREVICYGYQQSAAESNGKIHAGKS